MSRIPSIILVLVLIGIAGCSKTTTENTEQKQQAAVQESTPEAAEPQGVMKPAQEVAAPAPSKPAPSSRASSRPAQQAPMDVTEAIKATPQSSEPEQVSRASQAVEQQAAAPVRQQRLVTIPAGTVIPVRLQDSLDSSVNQDGDVFRAILDQDIVVDGNIVAPRGSVAEGKLSNVARSGRTKGRATMSLQLVSVQLGDGDPPYPFGTEVLAFEAESTKKEDATKVGIGAGIGAVIGAIAGGGKGAAIGAAAGAGAGGATVLATRGKEVKFEPEQEFNFKLIQDVSVRVE